MALYAYHRQLPKVSSYAPLLPAGIFETLQRTKKYVRKSPLLLGLLREVNPFLNWHAPSVAFGSEKLCASGELAAVMWLHRGDVSEPTTSRAPLDFGDSLARMTLLEFDRFVRESWDSCEHQPDVNTESARLTTTAVGNVPKLFLKVPLTLTSLDVAKTVHAQIIALENVAVDNGSDLARMTLSDASR
jgi:hypothetical protein